MDDVVALRPAAPFVGRTAELERLRELIHAVAAGGAAAVLLSGDAGVGKTSLLGEAARRAGEEGMLVLLGRCVDLGTGALPYLPFAEALSQLVRAGDAQQAEAEQAQGQPAQGRQTRGGQAGTTERPEATPLAAGAAIVRQVARERPGLARIAGGSGQAPVERSPGDTGLDRLALFEAVSHILGRIGDEVAPLLMIIEDLHWADASTRDLIRFLLARLGTDRLLVIASYRGDDLHRRHPLRPLLGELLRLPQVERMELLPFDDDDLAVFLRSVHGDRLPDDVLRQITARSAGNAYYAEELLAAGTGEQLPAGLADVLLDRLEHVSEPAQQVVRLAAVLGTARIEDSLLRAAFASGSAGGARSGDAAADRRTARVIVEDALREAMAHQLLIPDGSDRYAFRHALLQEAVYADLLPGERARLHATVAHRLAANAEADESQGDNQAAELARHSLAAHDLPLALTASLRAAVEARRRSAPAEALVHYEQVLQLWDAVDPDRRPGTANLVQIGVAAAAVAGDAGQHERAVQMAEAALAEALAADRNHVALARAAVALHTYGAERLVEAREQARRTIAELDDETPSATRVLARSIEARVDVSLSEPEAALEVIPAALTEAKALGLFGLQAELLTTNAIAHGMVGRPNITGQWDAARAAAERAGDRAAMVRVLYNTAIDRFDAGDAGGAVTLLEEGVQIADACGLTSSLYGAQCRSLLITVRWQIGDAEGALAVVRPTGQFSAGLTRQLRLYELPVLAARDPEHVVASGEWMVASDVNWDNQILQTARAEALYWLGRWQESAQAARKAIDFAEATAEPYALVGIAIGTTAVSALAEGAARSRERGEESAVEEFVESAQWFIDDSRDRGKHGRPRAFIMGPEGIAWLARLEAESARLRAEDDESIWAGVAEAFDGVSVYERARARWHRAELLVRAGEREQARIEAVGAREAAVQLGTKPLIAALDDLARRARLEVTKPIDGGLLTPREREVMALVAAGLTNRAIGERLFISEKTASVHVSNVLAKLGASGRAEAVSIIDRRGLID
jgi:DNA-binding CsgD family transcriptional regulator